MDISTLCIPVVIHIFLCVVYLLSYLYVILTDYSQFNSGSFIFDVLLNVLWIVFVYYLCSIGYITAAWLTIIIPFIMMFLILIGFLVVSVSSLSKPTPSATTHAATTRAATHAATSHAVTSRAATSRAPTHAATHAATSRASATTRAA